MSASEQPVSDGVWSRKKTALPQACDLLRHIPDAAERSESTKESAAILSGWGIPQALWSLDVDGSAAAVRNVDSNGNQTVWFTSLDRVFRVASDLDFDISTATFLDIGSGNGLACIYAVEVLGFKSAVGIEIDPNAVAAAHEILRDSQLTKATIDNCLFIEGDASNFILKDGGQGAYAVFLFNPFGSETLTKFLANNEFLKGAGNVIALVNDWLFEACLQAVWPAQWTRIPYSNCSLVWPDPLESSPIQAVRNPSADGDGE